jgi:hypothetical protein
MYTKKLQVRSKISNLVRKMGFWNNLHQVRSKPNILKVFGSKKIKGHKQDSQEILIKSILKFSMFKITI